MRKEDARGHGGGRREEGGQGGQRGSGQRVGERGVGLSRFSCSFTSGRGTPRGEVDYKTDVSNLIVPRTYTNTFNEHHVKVMIIENRDHHLSTSLLSYSIHKSSKCLSPSSRTNIAQPSHSCIPLLPFVALRKTPLYKETNRYIATKLHKTMKETTKRDPCFYIHMNFLSELSLSLPFSLALSLSLQSLQIAPASRLLSPSLTTLVSLLPPHVIPSMIRLFSITFRRRSLVLFNAIILFQVSCAQVPKSAMD